MAEWLTDEIAIETSPSGPTFAKVQFHRVLFAGDPDRELYERVSVTACLEPGPLGASRETLVEALARAESLARATLR